MKKNSEPIFRSLFEEDYLVRSLNSSITSQADIALTELVANAWDAGATKVSIFIPDEYGEFLVVEDDGNGLTEEEFQQRWMTLCSVLNKLTLSQSKRSKNLCLSTMNQRKYCYYISM